MTFVYTLPKVGVLILINVGLWPDLTSPAKKKKISLVSPLVDYTMLRFTGVVDSG